MTTFAIATMLTGLAITKYSRCYDGGWIILVGAIILLTFA